MPGMSRPEPGRAAIDRALDALYPGIVDLRFAGMQPADGSAPSLVEFTVYPCDEPRPHWHYIAYGLSEVFEKQTDDPETSGFGFELTYRLARGDGDEGPPPWPMRMLTWIADCVFDTGNGIEPLHVMRLTGVPMKQRMATELESVLFAEDPRLPQVTSSNGRVRFMQAVGITLDEEELIAMWDARPFLEEMRARSPLLVTDLARGSLLASEGADALRERARREGSQREIEFFAEDLRLESEPGMNKRVRLTLDEIESHALARLLRSRIPYRRRAQIQTPGRTLQILPAMEGYPPYTTYDGRDLVIGLPPEKAEEIAAALAERGEHRFPWFPELILVRE